MTDPIIWLAIACAVAAIILALMHRFAPGKLVAAEAGVMGAASKIPTSEAELLRDAATAAYDEWCKVVAAEQAKAAANAADLKAFQAKQMGTMT